MTENLPYSTSVGTLEKMLEKIKTASVPERFTQDFVSTKLLMKGGTAYSCIPFLKKMGFVSTDGSPTELYREFRNSSKSKYAVAKSFRKLYQRLYEMNEYVHDATEKEILGLIIECTGVEKDNATAKYTLSTLMMLRKLADFESGEDSEVDITLAQSTDFSNHSQNPMQEIARVPESSSSNGINLSYTINLNLPATKDVEVFNAIFKSLKEHLIKN
jgi:hypothetical protein